MSMSMGIHVSNHHSSEEDNLKCCRQVHMPLLTGNFDHDH